MLSAFLASETNVKNDKKNFKLNKVKTLKKDRKGKSLNYNLKVKTPFSFQRLISIFTSLQQYLEIQSFTECINVNERYNDINIICDFNSLVDLNLIKTLKSSDQNFIMSMKIITNFDMKFAIYIADQLGSRLNEFINIGN